MHLIYFTPIYMSLSSRIAGTRFKYFGLSMYALPYADFVYVLLFNNCHVYAIALSIVCYLWVFLWKLTGHADAFKNYQRDNFLSPVVGLFVKDRNGQTYDAVFWAIKGGLIASLPAAIITLSPESYSQAGAIFCASFCGYPLAYWLGFNKLDRKFGLVNTAWGELLAGLFAGLGFIFL